MQINAQHHHRADDAKEANRPARPGDHARKVAAADGADDEQGPEEEERANLDAGYAWLILLVMFLLQSSVGGSARVYGLVYAKEVASGYYNRQQASWPIATASFVENLAGILAPALVRRLSWRNIELVSTSLFVLANILAYLSDSLALDIIALGLVQGLALSTCTVLSLLINNDYFERYRTTAFGLSMCGSTFGLLYLGPLVSWLLATHDDFRLVYLALAGVFTFNMLLVLFIRPRAEAPTLAGWKRNRERRTSSAPHDKVAAPSPSGDPAARLRKRSRFETHVLRDRRESVASISYEARSRRASVLSRAMSPPPNDHHLQDSWPGLRSPLAKSKSGADLAGRLAGREKPAANEGLMKKISLCSVQASPASAATRPSRVSQTSSILQMSRQSSVIFMPIVEGNAKTTLTLNDQEQLDAASLYARLGLAKECSLETRESRAENPNQQRRRDSQWDGLAKLLCLPYLHCAWLMLALYYLVARIFVIILVDFAHDHGLDEAHSVGLLNYWSFGELLGRLLLGSLIDLRLLSCRSCIALTCASLAALMACMVAIESHAVYALCSLLVAALISLEYMLVNVMMVEYVGARMVTNCYSLAACLSSLVLFGRPTMIGFFRDGLGSYDGLLVLLATLTGSFAVLFYLLEPLMVRRWPKSSLSE